MMTLKDVAGEVHYVNNVHGLSLLLVSVGHPTGDVVGESMLAECLWTLRETGPFRSVLRADLRLVTTHVNRDKDIYSLWYRFELIVPLAQRCYVVSAADVGRILTGAAEIQWPKSAKNRVCQWNGNSVQFHYESPVDDPAYPKVVEVTQ